MTDKTTLARVATGCLVDGQLFSRAKGWEGWVGLNGLVYRSRRRAVYFGGGVFS